MSPARPSARPATAPPPLAAALAAVLLLGLASLAVRNLAYRGMWWDEAAQFWTSQGVSNYAEPFAARQGLFDVARWNAWQNLDPGGLSVLLHGWTAVSCGLFWLRLLPFLFFLLASLALVALGWRLTRSWTFAVASGAVLSLFPAALYFALEIRAYSMEMAGVALAALLLAAAVERPTTARAALLGLVCACFLTSRYSFVLAVAALLFALWRAGAGRAPARSRWRPLLAAGAPAVAAGAAIAVFMLQHQLKPDMRAGALGVISPLYTRAEVLRFAPDPLALLVRNLASPAALPITLATLLLLLRHGGLTDPVRRAVLLFVAGLQALSASISLLGLYPWDMAGRWSAYLSALSAVAVVALAAEARSRILARIAERAGGSGPGSRVRRLGAAVAAVTVVAGGLHAAVHRQSVESTHRTNVALQIDLLPPPERAPGRVYVAAYEAPMLRYLYEYGPYAGRPGYPARFRFETPAEQQAKVPVSAAREGVAFVISALTVEEARARFSGCGLRRYGPPGSRLLATEASHTR